MMLHTMNVVTRHMMTITEKVFLLRMPALTPTNTSIMIIIGKTRKRQNLMRTKAASTVLYVPKLSTISSTSPLVFMSAAMTLLSLNDMPPK